MTPHVPPPAGDLVIAAIIGIVAGLSAMSSLPVAARLFHRRLNRVAVRVGASIIAISTFAIVIQTHALDRYFGGYFSFKSPRDRLQDHFADFDELVAKDPEIRRALGGLVSDAAALKMSEMRILGVARLDDATLRRRAQLLAILLSQLSDHACACIVRGSRPTRADQMEVEQAMLRLESTFVAEWMQVIHQTILAQARRSPVDTVTYEEAFAASRALEAKIGADAAGRLRAGVVEGASDADRCWAIKTIYSVAPTLPEPHGTVLLRDLVEPEGETTVDAGTGN